MENATSVIALAMPGNFSTKNLGSTTLNSAVPLVALAIVFPIPVTRFPFIVVRPWSFPAAPSIVAEILMPWPDNSSALPAAVKPLFTACAAISWPMPADTTL